MNGLNKDSIPLGYLQSVVRAVLPVQNASNRETGASQTELRSPPHSPLGVEPDGVTRPHTCPLGDGAVLSLLLGQHALDLERLMSRHCSVSSGFVGDTRSGGGVRICACVYSSTISLTQGWAFQFHNAHFMQ